MISAPEAVANDGLPAPSLKAGWVIGGTALFYVLAGMLALALTAPGSINSPVHPAAGVALAAALAFGRVALPGVFVGALLLGPVAQLVGLWPAGTAPWMPAVLSLAATLQAWAGFVAVRHAEPLPLRLSNPRAIMRAGLLGGVLASTVSAGVGVAALAAAGSLVPGTGFSIWLVWWLADATGVILIVPMLLCFIGQPAADWRPRRRAVALPLLLALGLLALGTLTFERLQAQRAMATFERDANLLAHEVELRLLTPLAAPGALQGFQPSGLQHLDWCLLDADASASVRRIAGPPGCDAQRLRDGGRYWQQRRLTLPKQPLSLHISSSAQRLPGADSRNRWVVPAVGLLSSALLSALLLTITGQSRRTEQAVQEQTAQLRHQMAEYAQVQASLRDSENRMRSIVDNLPLGLALMDRQGTLMECNPRLCGMLGRSTEQLRGATVVSCFDVSEEARIRQLRDSLLNRQGTVDSVDSLRLRAANGRLTPVRVVATALLDEQGQLTHLVALVEDMTAHHQLQESQLALDRAEAASRAKSEFVSRMSHELRTPLNAMIGFAQLLALHDQPALAPRQLEWTQQIQRAGWHLLAMINDTLDLARIESGATRLNLEAVQIAPLLQACHDWVQQAATLRGVQLKLTVAADVPAALADSTRLKQVLTNLLSNAVKYNREGGLVDIQAWALLPAASPPSSSSSLLADPPGQTHTPRQLQITVTDSGLGMNAEQLSSLFQPYNRLGRESSAVEGTGIGLVISRRLAELMGGTLEAQSLPGRGSVFTLSLPATDDVAPQFTAPEQLGPARYQQRLVHYVEDNATNVEVMRGVLLQRKQITLQTSTLGLDGMSAIRHSRPDLILLDMQLPDISGLELLRHIKLDDQIASIPVIVVSADATPQNMERALTLGAQHYVTKPLDIASFLALVDLTLAGNETML